MALQRLVYTSRAVDGMTYAHLRGILETAMQRNFSAGLTGLLCYGDGRFLQTVEGDRRAVSGLLERLVVDERHAELEVLECRAIEWREFPDWPMRLARLEAGSNPAVVAHHRSIVGRDRFAPQEFDAPTALTFLTAVATEFRRRRASTTPTVA